MKQVTTKKIKELEHAFHQGNKMIVTKEFTVCDYYSGKMISLPVGRIIDRCQTIKDLKTGEYFIQIHDDVLHKTITFREKELNIRDYMKRG